MIDAPDQIATIEELEAAVKDAQLVLVVSARADHSALELADLSQGPSLPEWLTTLAENGRVLIGTLTWTDGTCAAHFVKALDSSILDVVREATVTHLIRRSLLGLRNLGLVSSKSAPEVN